MSDIQWPDWPAQRIATAAALLNALPPGFNLTQLEQAIEDMRHLAWCACRVPRITPFNTLESDLALLYVRRKDPPADLSQAPAGEPPRDPAAGDGPAAAATPRSAPASQGVEA